MSAPDEGLPEDKRFDDIGVGCVTGTPNAAHESNGAIYTTDFGFSHG